MLKKGIWLFAALIAANIFIGCNDDEDELLGDWTEGSEFEASPRANAVYFTIDNKLYLMGGYDGDDYFNDTWEYDPDKNWWKKMENFPGTPRTAAVGFSLDNKRGYIGTGYNGDSDVVLKDFWEFDPNGTPSQWKQVADFIGTPRYGAVAFAIDSVGYVGTGYFIDGSDKGETKDFYRYSPASNSWEQIVSIEGSKRRDATVFVIGKYAYLGTGTNSGSYEEDFHRFDATSETWTELRDLDYSDDYSVMRSIAVSFSINGYGYIGTGYKSGYLNDFWKYDPADDTWEEVTGLEGAARQDAIGFAVGNYGYVTTGKNGSNYFDDLWKFNPAAEYDDEN
ncbi:MAG: galactose oxidase [Salinivirgaceae bacterium]|nr:galactose oxidase [Salinivirgaceae bacterium]